MGKSLSDLSGKGDKPPVTLPDMAAVPDLRMAPLGALPDAPQFGATPQDLMSLQAQSSILGTSGPFGSSQIAQDPITGQYTRQTSLDPNVSSLLDRALDPSAGEAISQAQYDKALNLLRPELDRRREQADISFAARGLPVGSELRSDIESGIAREESDLLSNLALSAVLSGDQARRSDISQAMQLAGQVEGAQGPNINTLASYSLPYQASVLPYQQDIRRQELEFGAQSDIDRLLQGQEFQQGMTEFGAQTDLDKFLYGIEAQKDIAAMQGDAQTEAAKKGAKGDTIGTGISLATGGKGGKGK